MMVATSHRSSPEQCLGRKRGDLQSSRSKMATEQRRRPHCDKWRNRGHEVLAMQDGSIFAVETGSSHQVPSGRVISDLYSGAQFSCM
jgi:hypothetical protein